jgi:hypothetical protein
MFVITLVNGLRFPIEEKDVTRIQIAIPGVMAPNSSARIDARAAFDVVDDAQVVATHVRQVVGKTFTALTLPNGNFIWFSGLAAQGPVWIPAGEIKPNVKSAVVIANKKMFVRNSPAEVAAVLQDAGGYVIPFPNNTRLLGREMNVNDEPMHEFQAPELWADQVL